ncbi:MAG: GAF domain-containing protein, partial [Blastocatellia bacterium]|nr:GAF domain-containing protein [Blastocatellia bacterium]
MAKNGITAIISAMSKRNINENLERFKEFLKDANQADTTASLLKCIENAYKKYLPDSCFCLYLLDESKNKICCVLRESISGCDLSFPYLTDADAKPLGQWILETGSNTINPEQSTGPQSRLFLCAGRALHYIPITNPEGTRSLLTICSPPPFDRLDETAEFLNVFTHSAFLSFERTRIAEEKGLFAKIANLANRSDSIKDFLDSAVKELRKSFSAAGCSIFLYDENSQKLRLGATTGLVDISGKMLEYVAYDLGEGMTGWTGKHRRVVRLFDALDEQERLALDPTGELKINLKTLEEPYESSGKRHQFLSLPILSGASEPGEAKLVGVLRLYKKMHGVAFFPHDERLALTVCDALAPAIERWNLAEQELKLTDGLFEVVEAIHSEEDIKEVLRTIVEKAKDIFDGCAAALFLKNPDDETLSVAESLGYEERSQDVMTVKLTFEEGLVGYSAKHQETVAVSNVDKDSRYYKSLYTIRSAICTPIMIEGECRGVLNIDSDYPGRFSYEKRRTIRIMEVFAKQIAVVLHRADVAKERADLQQTLIRTTQLVTASQVASGLAHELKNGLAIVDGYAKSIERDPAIKSRKENIKNLDQMRQKASSLFDLAGRLMYMSRAGDPQRRLVYLNDVINETMKLLKPIIDSQGMVPVIRLDHSLSRPESETGVLIEVDDKQIAQVLINLVLNAMDASRRGQNITVTTRNVSNDRVEFSVRDFGTGIKPEDKDNIFKLFFTTKPDGFGVGLYVARLLYCARGKMKIFPERNAYVECAALFL